MGVGVQIYYFWRRGGEVSVPTKNSVASLILKNIFFVQVRARSVTGPCQIGKSVSRFQDFPARTGKDHIIYIVLCLSNTAKVFLVFNPNRHKKPATRAGGHVSEPVILAAARLALHLAAASGLQGASELLSAPRVSGSRH